MSLVIKHLNGARSGAIDEFDGNAPLTIGRDEKECLLAFAGEQAISSKHARIARLENGEYEIQDLNSRNGTFRNHRRIKREVVRANDVVSLGRHGPRLEILELSPGAPKGLARDAGTAGPAVVAAAARPPRSPVKLAVPILLIAGAVGGAVYFAKGTGQETFTSDSSASAATGSVKTPDGKSLAPLAPLPDDKPGTGRSRPAATTEPRPSSGVQTQPAPTDTPEQVAQMAETTKKAIRRVWACIEVLGYSPHHVCHQGVGVAVNEHTLLVPASVGAAWERGQVLHDDHQKELESVSTNNAILHETIYILKPGEKAVFDSDDAPASLDRVFASYEVAYEKSSITAPHKTPVRMSEPKRSPAGQILVLTTTESLGTAIPIDRQAETSTLVRAVISTPSNTFLNNVTPEDHSRLDGRSIKPEVNVLSAAVGSPVVSARGLVGLLEKGTTGAFIRVQDLAL